MHKPTKTSATMRSIFTKTDSMKSFQQQNNHGFLEILHQLLDESENSGHRIVAWSSDGLSFQIHNAQKFEKKLLPAYFGANHPSSSMVTQLQLTTYKSFLGQLKTYGFYRISNDGIYKDTCSHPLFVRGKKSLSLRMSRRQSFQRRESWPMPALNNNLTKNGSDGDTTNIKERERNENMVAYKPHHRTSISNLKRNKVPVRNLIASYSIDTRLSLKETLLCRRRSSSSQFSNRSQNAYLEFASNVSFDDKQSESNSKSRSKQHGSTRSSVSSNSKGITPAKNDASPMLCCSSSNTTYYQISDVEPLDHVSHEEDFSLYGDIAEALGTI